MYVTKHVLKNKPRLVKPAHYATELLKPIIILAQCFALLPVNINKINNCSSFKFKWISAKIFYTSIVFTLTLASSLICLYEMSVRGINLDKIGKYIYYIQ